jgi:hypothetical protein
VSDELLNVVKIGEYSSFEICPSRSSSKCNAKLFTNLIIFFTFAVAVFILQIVVSLAVAAMAIGSSVISCGKICNKQNNNLEPAVLYKATGPLPNYWPKY